MSPLTDSADRPSDRSHPLVFAQAAVPVTVPVTVLVTVDVARRVPLEFSLPAP